MGSIGTPDARRRRRPALIAAGSLLFHGLVLLLIGSYVPRSNWRIRNLDQTAVRVELQRRLPQVPTEQKPKPRPAPASRVPRPAQPQAAAAPAPAPAPVPHLATAPPPPGAPSPWTVQQPVLPPGFLDSLQAHIGCSQADLSRMSRSQREACAKQLAEGAADAPFIQAPIAPEKRTAFDRVVRCRKEYDNAGVPVGTDGWGLGYIPRLRDCGPKDH